MPDDARSDLPPLPLGRDTISWRINGGPVPFVGASTALLLQVAHPLVAAGVAQHSNYRGDPFGRLYRTLDTVLKLVFGSPETVEQMRRRLAARHRTVVGTASDGTEYDARDPDLGMWVWGTLVHTALLAHEYAYGALPPSDREQFYRESLPFAVASGVPVERLPATWDDFLAWYDHVITHDLAATPECADVADATFNPRVPPVVGRLGGRVMRWLAAALMPPRGREIYGLSWDDRRQRRFERFMRAVGGVLRLTPRPLRELGVVLVIDHDLLARLERLGTRLRAAAGRSDRDAA